MGECPWTSTDIPQTSRASDRTPNFHSVLLPLKSKRVPNFPPVCSRQGGNIGTRFKSAHQVVMYAGKRGAPPGFLLFQGPASLRLARLASPRPPRPAPTRPTPCSCSCSCSCVCVCVRRCMCLRARIYVRCVGVRAVLRTCLMHMLCISAVHCCLACFWQHLRAAELHFLSLPPCLLYNCSTRRGSC